MSIYTYLHYSPIQQSGTHPCNNNGAYWLNKWGKVAAKRSYNQPRNISMAVQQAKNFQRHMQQAHGKNDCIFIIVYILHSCMTWDHNGYILRSFKLDIYMQHLCNCVDINSVVLIAVWNCSLSGGCIYIGKIWLTIIICIYGCFRCVRLWYTGITTIRFCHLPQPTPPGQIQSMSIQYLLRTIYCLFQWIHFTIFRPANC